MNRPLVEVKNLRHLYGKPADGELLVLDDEIGRASCRERV